MTVLTVVFNHSRTDLADSWGIPVDGESHRHVAVGGRTTEVYKLTLRPVIEQPTIRHACLHAYMQHACMHACVNMNSGVHILNTPLDWVSTLLPSAYL